MKRVALLLAVPVLAACGAGADESSTPSAAAPILARASAAPVQAGATRAADGSASFAVREGVLLRFDPVTGRRTGAFDLGGAWSLGGVSATGRWVGLQRGGTEIRVVDTATGEARDVVLDGRFRVETISKDGSFLFLQQDFVDGSYAVRGYDLLSGRLLPGSLGTKGEFLKMQGRAGQVVASPDGKWLLTLYVNTKTQTAFIHALNLVDKIPICIVLPPCEDCGEEDLTGWKLTLRADNRTLVATHAAAGRAVFDLAKF